jgi:hypothetical protein
MTDQASFFEHELFWFFFSAKKEQNAFFWISGTSVYLCRPLKTGGSLVKAAGKVY